MYEIIHLDSLFNKMSLVTHSLSVATEPQFKLARDLTAMVIADGEVTPEENDAMSVICHREGADEAKLLENLNGGYEHVDEEMPTSYHAREDYLRNIIKLIGSDGYAAPHEFLVENKILVKEFDDMKLNFASMLKEEELKVYKKMC